MVINDIMLLKLERPAELNDFVQPACLPFGDDLPREIVDMGEEGAPPFPLDDESCTQHGPCPVVIGWGKSYAGDYNETRTVASANQQKLELPLVNNANCGDKWATLFKTDILREHVQLHHHLCAGGQDGKDSCKGDSGGPLVWKRDDGNPTYLVGAVSAGTSTCGIGTPAIFTRITSHIEWIRNILAQYP